MTIARQVDLRANIKKYFDLAISGEPVIVPRRENKNVVIISEDDYKEMEKALRNAEYLKMIDASRAELEGGEAVRKTMEELRAMEDDGVNELLDNIDVLVDGEYRESERDLTLRFRGSRNQRVIDMRATRMKNEIVIKYVD